MKIHLDRVVDEAFDWQETLRLTPDELGLTEVVEIGEIACQGRVRPLATDYLFEVSLSYVQVLRCMRCLEAFDSSIASKVSLLIDVKKAETAEEELELEEEDLGTLSIQTPELDTRPILTEQLHLEVPMKPLCRDDCSGLCSECGRNLNEGRCNCDTGNDPRWSALEKLKLRTSSDETH